MLSEACEGDDMWNSSISEWHRRFKEGREDVEDNENCGRLKPYRTEENVEKMRDIVHSDT
jgi:hypothetical protein